jgi:YhcH/YjgK/YiaL family protein
MKRIAFFVVAILTLVSCATMSKGWESGWDVPVSSIVDKSTLRKHVAAHPQLWKAAFEFLQANNLAGLPNGRYQILGDEVYANVSEYSPRDPEKCLYESHKKYIDFQYLISGSEKMEAAEISDVSVKTDYNPKTDAATYFPNARKARKTVATPKEFFVFFPSDAHRPCIKVDDTTKVKKIVIKIAY